jgi:hypothetical protein
MTERKETDFYADAFLANAGLTKTRPIEAQ